MSDRERFQAFCRFCQKVKEADSAQEAIDKVTEHELECPRKPPETVS